MKIETKAKHIIFFSACLLICNGSISCRKQEKATQTDPARAVDSGMLQNPAAGQETTSHEPGTSVDSTTENNNSFIEESRELRKSGQWTQEMTGFYQHWAAFDPESALAYARGNEGLQDGALPAVLILETWAKAARNEAFQWVAKQEAIAERSLWLKVLVDSWPLDSPSAPIESKISEWMEAPSGLLPAKAYGHRLSETNPRLLSDWFTRGWNQFPESLQIARVIVQEWAADEPEAASEWLAQADANAPWRNDAIEGLAIAVKDLNPEEAKAWVNSINDEKRREEALARLQGPR